MQKLINGPINKTIQDANWQCEHMGYRVVNVWSIKKECMGIKDSFIDTQTPNNTVISTDVVILLEKNEDQSKATV